MLNKYTTIIIFIFCIGLTSNGQQFHGGIIVGLAGTQVAGDTYSGYNKAGIFAGGFVSIDVGQKSALQMELTYFQKGSRENPREKNGYKQYLLRLNYIELPIFYQYKAGRFTIEAGPSAGFLVGYFEDNILNPNPISDDPEIPPARVTLQINLGVRFAITQQIGVDVRTNNSLMNVFSKNRTGDVWRLWDHGRYNDSLVLSLYYLFR